MNKQPIIGLIPYSASRGGGCFNNALIFNEDYLRYRWELFNGFTLPSLKAQENQDFIALVLHSTELPAAWKEKFAELEKENGFLKCRYISPEGTPVENMNAAINQFALERCAWQDGVGITFRLDNDDALHKRYISGLSRFLRKEFDGFAISDPNIMQVMRWTKNRFVVSRRYYFSNSIGFALVCGPGAFINALEMGDHTKANRERPVISLTGDPAAAITGGGKDNATPSTFKRSTAPISKTLLRHTVSRLPKIWRCF